MSLLQVTVDKTLEVGINKFLSDDENHTEK